ncbi:MAG TPA: hypothetical protein VIS27_09680 [Yeosuana sp.]
MARKKTIGKLMLEMEVLLDEMIDQHELQCGDIMNLVYGHLVSHRPDAFEEYVDEGTVPKFYYGPSDEKK